MMEVCHDLKGLVDRGAVEIGAAVREPLKVADVIEIRTAPEVRTSAVHHDLADATVSLLEPSEPYAPESDDFVTAEAAAEAAANADAVAAGIVSRMARARLSTPDVFASGDEAPGDIASGSVADGPAEVVVTTADSGESATGPEEAAPDRGALLRLFSALKES
jgi:hypothetical protein